MISDDTCPECKTGYYIHDSDCKTGIIESLRCAIEQERSISAQCGDQVANMDLELKRVEKELQENCSAVITYHADYNMLSIDYSNLEKELAAEREKVKELEKSLECERTRFKRLLTTDGKGVEYKAQLIADIILESKRDTSSSPCGIGWASPEEVGRLLDGLRRLSTLGGTSSDGNRIAQETLDSFKQSQAKEVSNG